MILTARVVPGIAICVALATLTASYFAGIGDAPSSFFGGDNTFIIAPPGGGVIGSATLPEALAGPLGAISIVQAASPEIFVPTTLAGRSVLARGVDFSAFFAIEGAHLADGSMPQDSFEALAGRGFAKEFDVHVGSVVALPSPSLRATLPLHVVGIYETSGIGGQEILVSLHAARALSGIPDGQVHIVRALTNDTDRLRALVGSVAPSFTYSDVRLSSLAPQAGDEVMMRANLTNWGRVEGIKQVVVHLDGKDIATRGYKVGPLATIPVELPFSILSAGPHNITINPTFNVNVAPGNLTFAEAPEVAIVGARVVLKVTDPRGEPQAGIQVQAGPYNATSDDSGFVFVTFGFPGTFTLTARGPASGERATRPILVVAPELGSQASGIVTNVSLDQPAFGAERNPKAHITLENRGGALGDVAVPLLVANRTVATATATLAPGESATIQVSLPPLLPGNYTLGALNGTGSANLTIIQGTDPAIEALLEAYENHARTAKFSASTGDLSRDYVRRTLGNLEGAILVLSLGAGALAGLALVLVVERHIAQRRGSIATLKALGAPRRWVVESLGWEAGVFAAIGALVGIAAGTGGAIALDRLQIVRAFGHTIHPALAWTTLDIIMLASILVAVAVSRRRAAKAMAEGYGNLVASASADPSPPLAPELREILEARRAR